MTWNTLDIVEAAGGEAVKSKSGHSFIKEKMREVDGVYGGEMSAHHYFRDFSYADSGMIPWLLVAELLSTTGKSLSELVGERMAMYPASGEINRKVEDAAATLQKLHDTYANGRAGRRRHGWLQLRVRRLALQYSHVEYGAGGQAECRDAGGSGVAGREDSRGFGDPRIAT